MLAEAAMPDKAVQHRLIRRPVFMQRVRRPKIIIRQYPSGAAAQQLIHHRQHSKKPALRHAMNRVVFVVRRPPSRDMIARCQIRPRVQQQTHNRRLLLNNNSVLMLMAVALVAVVAQVVYRVMQRRRAAAARVCVEARVQHNGDQFKPPLD